MDSNEKRLVEKVCPTDKVSLCSGTECIECELILNNLIKEHDEKLIDEFVIYLIANTITLDSYDIAIIKRKAEEWKANR